jgi:hypothetical protein
VKENYMKQSDLRNKINKQPKHTWLPTGKFNEFSCCRCGVVKVKEPVSGAISTYYRNGIKVQNTGCIKK